MPQTPIEEEIVQLRSWPDRKATRAAEKLFLRGTEIVPVLVQTLNQGDPSVHAGTAWVLGLGLILFAARRRRAREEEAARPASLVRSRSG